ncbi:Os08g0400250, partial [Oryza sativa Japonica Group]
LNERTPLDQIGGHSHQIQQSALAFHNCRSSKDDWQNCITERLPAAGSGWWFLQTHSFRL